MKVQSHQLRLSAIALAVSSVLVSMAAKADEAEIKALTQPNNTVELSVITPSQSTGASAKFGEYNGLNTGATRFTGGLNIRGGSAYTNNEQGGLERWALKATDIGLMSGSAEVSAAEQGVWSYRLGFDSLRHNLDNSYQTPYIGAIGGNSFTLPTNFGLASTSGAGTNVLTANQLAAFHKLDISSTRQNSSISAALAIDARNSLSFDFNHLAVNGSKLMGFGVAGVGGATGEAVTILPMPTASKTDTVTVAWNWKGDQSFLTASYFGSFYTDDFDRVNFQSFAGTTAYTGALQAMTTPPSNSFNQLNLQGGQSLGPKTKWVANVSYGRNTQNSAFVTPETGLLVTPTTNASLNGEVINTHADLKLTDRSYQDWTLSAGLKFDERDNQTTSYMQNFNAISGQHTALYPNTPLSNKKSQAELAGDYRIKSGQSVRMAYVHEDIQRWCNSYAVGTGYPAGTNCVTATSSKDDRIDASYRLKALETVDFRIGLGYSDRQTTTDPFAISNFIGTNGAVPGPVPSPNLTPKGQNAGDYYGFYPFFTASRTQQSVKGQVNWEATDQIFVGLSAKYTEDKYGAGTYGVQNGNTWSFNADTSYAYQENGSVYAYASKQHRQRELTSLQRSTVTAGAASATAIAIPAVASWTNMLKDDDTTVGIGIKQGGLLGGKLEVSADLTYSLGAGAYGTNLNYSTTTTGGLTCSAAAINSCGQLPDIKSTMGQASLTGVYQVDKESKVTVRYAYQKLSSADYYYNGYQYGFSPATLIPTNQASPNYKVNAIAVTLTHSF
jgi:MtrB/PioB family decaheme-associated outer membrane protein